MTDRISLKASGWEIDIAPNLGASITSCRFQGRDIFRPAALSAFDPFDPVQMSNFPLVPFSNRIAPQQFSFDGADYSYPPNFKGQSFAMHGEGWIRPWSIKTQSINSCRLELDYHPSPGSWPFPFLASHEIKIEDSALLLSLDVKNTGPSPCPAGLGLHPYFPDASQAMITFDAQHMWEADSQCLPISRKVCAGLIDYSGGRPAHERALDNVFSGWSGEATIRWQGRPDTLIIQAYNAPNLVVYTPAGEDFFCVEPVSHINNALNIAAQDTDDGMKTLAPGQSLTLKARFSVT